ncbi:WbqC family protein [Pseudomonas sp. CGJS7]|uniref:WbqC family protein n=1 Tax=Pseudomonas sp. CGJS7 TaxID=3109348 RepID=UPI003009E0F6
MSSRVVIIQSNYIPWKGYFDLLAHADRVVLLDSVQSTKNDWRNRNQIKAPGGKLWLTVPTRHSTRIRISEVEIAAAGWSRKHLASLRNSYARAPFAARYLPELAELYAQAEACRHLSQVNRIFIRYFADTLGIRSEFVEVESLLSYPEHDAFDPTQRLVEICKRVGAGTYLSGPSARSYLDESRFAQAAIAVRWFGYDGYPPYPQLHGDFDPAVSIVDLLLMTGPDARKYALRN